MALLVFNLQTGSDWPGGLPEIPGGLVGLLAGGQQKDILFLLAIDVINHDKKEDCLSRVVMAKRHKRKTVNIKL